MAQAPVILAAVDGPKMTSETPYCPWVAPPPTEAPGYAWGRKYDPKPLKPKSSKLIEIKVEEFRHPSREAALKAAKMAVRGKPGKYFGSMENERGFNVYLNGKVVERHWVGETTASQK